jgi:hypothetical protein
VVVAAASVLDYGRGPACQELARCPADGTSPAGWCRRGRRAIIAASRETPALGLLPGCLGGRGRRPWHYLGPRQPAHPRLGTATTHAVTTSSPEPRRSPPAGPRGPAGSRACRKGHRGADRLRPPAHRSHGQRPLRHARRDLLAGPPPGLKAARLVTLRPAWQWLAEGPRHSRLTTIRSALICDTLRQLWRYELRRLDFRRPVRCGSLPGRAHRPDPVFTLGHGAKDAGRASLAVWCGTKANQPTGTGAHRGWESSSDTEHRSRSAIRQAACSSGGRRPPGTGQRLGPDHIGVSRVSREVLRPGTRAPDPQPAGADVLHVRTSRCLRRPPPSRPGRLRALSRAGPGGGTNTSPATARAQRIRSTAASG